MIFLYFIFLADFYLQMINYKFLFFLQITLSLVRIISLTHIVVWPLNLSGCPRQHWS